MSRIVGKLIREGIQAKGIEKTSFTDVWVTFMNVSIVDRKAHM